MNIVVTWMFSLAILLNPGAEQNGTSPVHMTGTPLPDPSLPPSTIAVRVVGESFKDPLAGVKVELIRAEDFQPGDPKLSKLHVKKGVSPIWTGVTAKTGRARVTDPKLVGGKFRLRVTHKAQVTIGQVFQVTSSGGQRFIFTFGSKPGGMVSPSAPRSSSFKARATCIRLNEAFSNSVVSIRSQSHIDAARTSVR